ncbi:hypothetical protein DES40_0877 [Litorimonas taeanensis]|uniref:N-acetyltransferase domain-containing protein n=1 Tax=Litorimonas taeanensis TaxID=568099 RepID=A0A420WKW8_9PROT|nr:hypothetical protein [Litorimonas taeanensis]RKQ71552.1 hypothetical protein DES40_0877 [Litorimonas taeanensis]
MTFVVKSVETKAELKVFLDLPYSLYRADSNWRAPLRFERSEQFSVKKNPGAPTERALFLAYHGAKCVGRIAAFINEYHDEHCNDNAGFFGYLDCAVTEGLTETLLKSAEDWLISKGRQQMIGPAQWSVNEECGLLIEGFDTPPVVMMPYGRPDYKTAYESFGLLKATDMFAFQADLSAGYPRSKFLQSLLNYADKNKSITWRSLDMSKFRQEVDLIMDIFNDAWSENWGFVPFSDEQISHMAKEIRPLIFKEGLWIGYIDGEPAAFICMIPDLNELTKGLNGKLLPFGWAKLVWRLKVSGAKQSRIPLMGLRKKHQNTRKGLSLVAQLCETVFAAGRVKGFTHCELSWILEDNEGMIGICEQAAAQAYKTYRMYKKDLVVS